MKLEQFKQFFFFFSRRPAGRIAKYQEIRWKSYLHGLFRHGAENLLAFPLAKMFSAIKSFSLCETIGYFVKIHCHTPRIYENF